MFLPIFITIFPQYFTSVHTSDFINVSVRFRIENHDTYIQIYWIVSCFPVNQIWVFDEIFFFFCLLCLYDGKVRWEKLYMENFVNIIFQYRVYVTKMYQFGWYYLWYYRFKELKYLFIYCEDTLVFTHRNSGNQHNGINKIYNGLL